LYGWGWKNKRSVLLPDGWKLSVPLLLVAARNEVAARGNEKYGARLQRHSKCFTLSGERGRNRTYNLLIKSQLLCQLSYAPASKSHATRSTCRVPPSSCLGTPQGRNSMPTWTLLHKPGVITVGTDHSRPVRERLTASSGRGSLEHALHAVAPLNRFLWSRLVRTRAPCCRAS
jgi:hypothetical protein